MTPLMITQLLIAFGPSAIGLIQQLISVWSKPSLTTDEVMAICAVASKSYDQYIADAKAKITPLTPPTSNAT